MNDSTLTPAAAAELSAKAVHDLAANFMLDPGTYASAAVAGYQGMDFYFAGRGGVLGDVSAAAVAEAFVFFPLSTAQSSWDGSATVEDRSVAGNRFASAAHDWARAHLPEGAVDYARLAELADKVIQSADGSTAPVFAGWRELDEPSEERELVLHRMNALRELRAARHGDAVKAVGMEPVEAFMVKTPFMAKVFGWPEPELEPDTTAKDNWARAEELTNEAFGRDLSALSSTELAEFCDLANAVLAAAS